MPSSTSVTSAALQLFHDNRRLAFHIARRYVRFLPGTGLEVEDLDQLALQGLWVAAQRFEPERGWKFSTYAWHWVRQAITKMVRHRRVGERPLVPESDLTGNPEGDLVGRIEWIASTLPRSLARQQSDVEALDDHLDAVEVLAGILDRLPKRYQLVLTLRYGLDGRRPLTLAEVGREMGVCRERIRQLEATAIELARELSEQRAAVAV